MKHDLNIMAFGAGARAAANYVSSQRAVAENSWDPDELIKQSMRARSAEKQTAMAAEKSKRVSDAKIDILKSNNDTRLALAQNEMDLKKGVRKAGLVATAGVLAGSALTKKPEMQRPDYSATEAYIQGYAARTQEDRNKLTDFITQGVQYPKTETQNPTGTKTEAVTKVEPIDPVAEATTTPPRPKSSVLTGNAKMIADKVAMFESGDYGYDAFNQGGKKGGTEVVGKYGRFAESGIGDGRSLTQMTVGEVIKQQSGYDDFTISDAEWRRRGGIHAVGRYQFIGPTLKEQVARSGIPMDAMFDEATQDKLFIDHLKYVGRIDPTWVGPAKNMDPGELSRLNALVPSL